MKLIHFLLSFCLLLCATGCSHSTNFTCTKCGAQISADAIYCSKCGEKTVKESFSQKVTHSEPTIPSTTALQIDWTSCPIYITGGISGSSYYEYFSLSIQNLTAKDIDSVKVLVCFTHTGIDNHQEAVTGYHTINTIWANSSSKTTIPARGYNFSQAEIYPVCIYFKDGSKWGDSTADYSSLRRFTLPFYIEHFAKNDSLGEGDQLGMLPDFEYDDEVIEEWYYEEPERDLDGIQDYLEDMETLPACD